MIEQKTTNPAMIIGDDKKPIKELREELARTVRTAKELKIPTIILFEGWGASGKGYMIEKLIAELDPRGYKVYSIKEPVAEETRYPMLKRFWEKIPSAGNISIFDRSWYREVSIARVEDELTKKIVDRRIRDILEFERQLHDDGCIIIKFFLQISKKEQAARFERLENDPATSWRVTKDDHRRHKKYDEYYEAFSEMIERTDSDLAPWRVFDASDMKMTATAVAKIVNDVMKKAIDQKLRQNADDEYNKKNDGIDYEIAKTMHRCPILQEVRRDTTIENKPIPRLDEYDLTLDVTDEEYKTRLKKLQKELFELHNELYRRKIPVVIAFEGWDAAGKGGAIKRLVSGLDPRGYEVNPVAAPTPTELSYQYMRRFWQTLPKTGHIGIYDRSWYGRVMVERLEGFAKQREWTRAYDEINKFERTLTDSGAIMMKFWLHIDDAEQLKRFNARMNDPDKQWKITDEDWRNRDKRLGYHIAVDQMLELTNTSYAPWIVVEANSKHYARLKVLSSAINQIRSRL